MTSVFIIRESMPSDFWPWPFLIKFIFPRMTPSHLNRFERAFTESANTLLTIKGTHFVLINSITLEQDGCVLCKNAEADIEAISKRLTCEKEKSNSAECQNIANKLPFYSRPVLLQHFPTYRNSDDDCYEHDSYEVEVNKERWDVLSKNATDYLDEQLHPSVVFCGHTHHYCRSKNRWGIEEYTVASFNRRQKWNPSFLLVICGYHIFLFCSSRNQVTCSSRLNSPGKIMQCQSAVCLAEQ